MTKGLDGRTGFTMVGREIVSGRTGFTLGKREIIRVPPGTHNVHCPEGCEVQMNRMVSSLFPDERQGMRGECEHYLYFADS